MITIMIVSQKNKINEMLASSIIGGLDATVNLISTTDTAEAESIISNEHMDIDLFILQVKMKPKSGTILESLLRQKERYKNKPVLFLTNLSYNMVGYPKLAGYESYKRKNYISMPIERTDVQAKLCLYLDRILKEQKQQHRNLVYLEHDRGELFLERKDILYIEVQNKLLTLHCKSGDFELKRVTLQEFCLQLGLDAFVRCHKSFVINVEAVDEIVRNGRRNWLAVFGDGKTCPISQTYYDLVKRKYMQMMTKKDACIPLRTDLLSVKDYTPILIANRR